MAKVKAKICAICKEAFIPKHITPVCSFKCALEYNKEKEVKKRVKEMKSELRTHKDYIKTLQIIFNTYIRLRDKNKACISCGVNLGQSFDAGHFFSVGANPGLRFNEDNVHGQCKKCNLHLHSNASNYALELPNRIGLCKFKALIESKNATLKITIPEIKLMIKHYKALIKDATNT